MNDVAEVTKSIEAKYGLLVTHQGLAELLNRSLTGLRQSLTQSNHPEYVALRQCSRRVGRRLYYPAADVAKIVFGGGEATR